MLNEPFAELFQPPHTIIPHQAKQSFNVVHCGQVASMAQEITFGQD